MWFKCMKRTFTITLKGKKQTYYQILDLPQNANQKKIKAQFYRLSKIYHPDVYKGAELEKYGNIIKAYSFLKDANKRAKYDREIQAHENFEKREVKESEEEKPENVDSKWKDLNNNNDAKFSVEKMQIELENLKKKEITTNFEEINVAEGYIERKMTKEEKDRAKFVEEFNKNRDIKDYTETVLSYKETLSEKIEMINEAKKQEMGIDKIGVQMSRLMLVLGEFKWWNYFLIGFVGFWFVVFSFWMKITQRRTQEKKEETRQIIVDFEKRIAEETRNRFIYDKP